MTRVGLTELPGQVTQEDGLAVHSDCGGGGAGPSGVLLSSGAASAGASGMLVLDPEQLDTDPYGGVTLLF
ncbi:MAG: hypothetical protein PVI30_05910 [Myxococcales bacterium]